MNLKENLDIIRDVGEYLSNLEVGNHEGYVLKQEARVAAHTIMTDWIEAGMPPHLAANTVLKFMKSVGIK